MQFLTFLHRHRVHVFSVYALIVLYGTAAAGKIPVELLPVLPLPGVSLVTTIEGFSAEEVETMVTVPLERGLLELTGLRRMTSVSEEGLSTISLEFALGTETSLAFAQTAETADEVYPRLPDGASKPVLTNTSRTEEGPLIRAAVEPRGISFEELAASAEKILNGRLLHSPAIGRVSMSGTLTPRISIRADSELLTAAGIAPSTLTETLRTGLTEYFLGTVENRGRKRSLRLTGNITSPEDISSLPVPSPEGGYSGLTLGDLAQVTEEFVPGKSWAYRNGRPFLGITLYRNPTVPTLEAARKIRTLFALLEAEYPYLSFSVIEDGSAHLRSAVRELLAAVILSTLSAFLVVSLFYSSFRAGLIILASLPCSLLPTILTLHLLGKGLNTVSLAGMVMGVGLIVDCSILVFHRYLFDDRGDLRLLLPALTASTATSALVFIPVLFLPGITSALFRDLALTVTLLLLYSLVAAAVLVPTLIGLAPRSLRPERVRQRCAAFEGRYLEILRRFGPRTVIAGFAAVVIGALLGGLLLPKTPLPEDRSSRYLLRAEISAGTSEEDIRNTCGIVARELGKLPGSPKVIAEGEGSDISCLLIFPESVRFGRRSTPVPPLAEVEEFLSAVLPGRRISEYTLAPPPSPLSPFFSTTEKREYLLLADTREKLSPRIGPICSDLVKSGLCDSAEPRAGNFRHLTSFILDPALVRLTGSDPESVRQSVSLKSGTESAGVLHSPSGPVEVRCSFDPGRSGEISPVVPTPAGTVPLVSLGSPENVSSAVRLERFGGNPVATIRIRSSASGKRLRAFISESGEGVELVSRDEHLTKSIRNVLGALAVSVFLIFFYLVLHYSRFRLPLLLVAFLPLSAGGSLFVMAVFGRSINIGSVLGILITLGTSLNTLIVTAQNPSAGVGATAAVSETGILEAAASRIYPLAVTVATTVCAAVPGIILCKYAFQRDTAVAVAGGILIGSILLMFIFPPVLRMHLNRRAPYHE